MKVRQCYLESLPHQGAQTTLVCWLEDRPDLRDGVVVTLKDHDNPSLRWMVQSVGDIVKEKSEIHRPGAFFESDI